jgi:hypothetical protein
MLIQFYENNSGGYRRLTENNWEALAKNGWDIRNFNSRPSKSGPYASKEFNSVKDAIDEWESLTDLNSKDPGCSCCGDCYEFYSINDPSEE